MEVKNIPDDLHQAMSEAAEDLVNGGGAIRELLLSARITRCRLDELRPTSVADEGNGALRVTAEATFSGDADPEGYKGDSIDAVLEMAVRQNQEGKWEVGGITTETADTNL